MRSSCRRTVGICYWPETRSRPGRCWPRRRPTDLTASRSAYLTSGETLRRPGWSREGTIRRCSCTSTGRVRGPAARAVAVDPRHRPEVLQTDGWDQMRWERLRRIDETGSWTMHVLDTSGLTRWPLTWPPSSSIGAVVRWPDKFRRCTYGHDHGRVTQGGPSHELIAHRRCSWSLPRTQTDRKDVRIRHKASHMPTSCGQVQTRVWRRACASTRTGPDPFSCSRVHGSQPGFVTACVRSSRAPSASSAPGGCCFPCGGGRRLCLRGDEERAT